MTQDVVAMFDPQAVYAFPSLDTLARETTLSKPTVIHLIRVLEALGELEVRRGHGRGHPNQYRISIDHETPPEGSPEEDDDQSKGQPRLYLLPTEKVKAEAEKVKEDPGKGQASVDPKEVLRTSKDNTERGASLEKRLRPTTRTPRRPSMSSGATIPCGIDAAGCIISSANRAPTSGGRPAGPDGGIVREADRGSWERSAREGTHG